MKFRILWYDYKETIEDEPIEAPNHDAAVKAAFQRRGGNPPKTNMMIYAEEIPG